MGRFETVIWSSALTLPQKALLLILVAYRESLSARVLSALSGISLATVKRSLCALRDLGVLVVGDAGDQILDLCRLPHRTITTRLGLSSGGGPLEIRRGGHSEPSSTRISLRKTAKTKRKLHADRGSGGSDSVAHAEPDLSPQVPSEVPSLPLASPSLSPNSPLPPQIPDSHTLGARVGAYAYTHAHEAGPATCTDAQCPTGHVLVQNGALPATDGTGPGQGQGEHPKGQEGAKAAVSGSYEDLAAEFARYRQTHTPEQRPSCRESRQVLEALESQPALAAIATRAVAEVSAGEILSGRYLLADALSAIADLASHAASAAATGSPWCAETLARKLINFSLGAKRNRERQSQQQTTARRGAWQPQGTPGVVRQFAPLVLPEVKHDMAAIAAADGDVEPEFDPADYPQTGTRW